MGNAACRFVGSLCAIVVLSLVIVSQAVALGPPYPHDDSDMLAPMPPDYADGPSFSPLHNEMISVMSDPIMVAEKPQAKPQAKAKPKVKVKSTPAKAIDVEKDLGLSETCGTGASTCGKTACDGCYTSTQCCPRQKCSGIKIGGWLSGGIYSNAWGANNNALPMREQTGGTMDQLWVYAEKRVNTGGCGVDWGGRADFMFGADAQYTRVGPSHSTLPMLDDFSDNGWDHQWTTSDDGVYGSALPQLYGEIGINDWTFRAGHFFSLVGYERIPVVNNFFYSRSYAFGIEPITHMGALASYQLADGLEVTGGITNGWDNGWLNPSKACTGLGKISADLNDSMTLHYALTFGDIQPGNQVYLHSLVLEWQLSERWEYVLQSDFAVDTGGAADVRQDYGMNQYLFYKINECWKVGARIEWLRAESYNTRVHHNNVFETRTGMTFGVNYSPTRNLMIRPELRWDSANGPMSNDFNDRRNTYQFAGGLDVILRF